ncbi:hypothetical protein Tco_1207489 [Tanacetum coccineum]
MIFSRRICCFRGELVSLLLLVDTSIRASESRVMTAIGEDDRALLGAQVSILRKERRCFRSMASSYERETVIA